ncbi:unnamed protein product [Toxocara canis]|uniref:DUF4614 domain-containing protein n=1 Tax=Toxocara canis TaxID=6265 RepID=A0A183VGV6_TOXCA|nr:unnamed protein product [Toxocara canis]
MTMLRYAVSVDRSKIDEIPPFSVPRRTNRRQSVACTSDEGIDATVSAWAKIKEQGRRQSAPVIGRSDAFHKKLAHLRQSNSLSSADEEDEDAEEKAYSRRSSKQAFMSLLEAARENKESPQSEQLNEPKMRRGSGSPKSSEKHYAHRASVVFIDDNEVSSIQSSAPARV